MRTSAHIVVIGVIVLTAGCSTTPHNHSKPVPVHAAPPAVEVGTPSGVPADAVGVKSERVNRGPVAFQQWADRWREFWVR
jgi:hypothetical protein